MRASPFDRDDVSAQAELELRGNVEPTGWKSPQPQAVYRLIVIGGGPAGIAAARIASGLGARVALVERTRLGGESLSDGAIPTGALIRTARLYSDMRCAATYGATAPPDISVDFTAAMARMRRIRARVSRTDSAMCLAREGIDVFFGDARFVGADAIDVDGRRMRFRQALIATGSRSLVPDVPGLAQSGFLTNDSVFDLPSLPSSLLVIGGGPLGCELAQVFARFGTRTLIAHREPLFLPKEERDAAQMVSDALARDGVEIHLNTAVTAVRAEGARKVVDLVDDGNTMTTTVDHILTGIGRLPAVRGLDLEKAGVAYDLEAGIQVDDFLRTTNPRIFAAGDVCLQDRYTNTAEASAEIVVHNALLFGRRRMSALTVPWCTYTDPEVAHVGLHVRTAREQRIAVKTFTIPMHEVDRAIADSEDDGFVKIHVREGTDRILGGTIVSRQAGEMINVISLAMVYGIGLAALARVIHAYPTHGEAIRMAAAACKRTRTSRLMNSLIKLWLKAR